MSYKHIKPDQKVELAVLLRTGMRQGGIAKALGKHPSSISREIARNKTEKGKYSVILAKRNAKKMRILANRRFRKIENDRRLRDYVISRLRKYWSPEQIAGKLKRLRGKTVVCHETIYRFIYGKRPDLKKYLRCQKGRYRRRHGTIKREKARDEAKKRRIDERPAIVETRERIGDFEGDTVVGGERKQRVLTHVERKCGYLLADKLDKVSAEIVKEKTVSRFKSLSKKKKFTVTYDNGPEFAAHELIGRETGMDVYFAYPYHSWERGTNENTNGLLRQFMPKKSSFAAVTQEKLDGFVALINHRPRKRLNYLSPYEVFIKNCTLY